MSASIKSITGSSKIVNRPAWNPGGLPINCAFHASNVCWYIKSRTYQTEKQKNTIWRLNVLAGGVGRYRTEFGTTADGFSCSKGYPKLYIPKYN